MMRVLVTGAGATGGFFGGKLAQAGRDVTFLVRARRAAQLEESGLQILSPAGDFTLAPKLVTAAEIAGPFDLILLAVKSYSLDSALADIAPAVGPNTMVLPLLNGMAHVDAITSKYGAGALIGGVCHVAAALDDAGRVVQTGTFNNLAYGEMDGARSERIVALDRLMQGAGFNARLSLSIENEMWEKWVMLASLGGINCLLRANVAEIAATPGGPALVNQFINEVVSVVSACGHPPTADFVAYVTDLLTATDSPRTSSMYRDFQAGLPVEAAQILGDLVELARQKDLATPLLSASFLSLSIYARLR